MRLHRSERLQNQWYGVSPEIRRFVESLKQNFRRDDCIVSNRPNRYEDFVGGKWVIWEIDDSGGETVIRVTISD
jgi:hypothetical protein